jgi:undecaprenyl diphosphate synthase
MPRSFGHKNGMERMIGLMEHAFDLGVDYITVYALSTENLKRPKEELEGLFNLFRNHFKQYISRVCARGVRLRAIGNVSLLPEDIQKSLRESEEETACYEGKGICVAVGYGRVGHLQLLRKSNFGRRPRKLRRRRGIYLFSRQYGSGGNRQRRVIFA